MGRTAGRVVRFPAIWGTKAGGPRSTFAHRVNWRNFAAGERVGSGVVKGRIVWFMMAPLLPLLTARPVSADAIETKMQFCAQCHGRNGPPTDRAVPIIMGQQAAYLQKELNDYRNGDRDNQIMSSIAESLSGAEVSQLATLLSKAKWPASPDTVPPPAPDAVAACQACHNANFTGGVSPAGVAPRLAGQNAAYLSDTMNAYAAGERANNATMSALMQNLSPAMRRTIADYLAAIR